MRSLYFAVSALSTGGLQSNNLDPDTGNLTGKGGNALVSLFVGVYVMTGVPIFGVALGQFAGFFVDSYVARKEEEAMTRLLTQGEFDFVKSLGSDDGEVDFGEFLALELLRLNKIDQESLATAKREFDLRDADGSGTITWDEIVKFHQEAAFIREMRTLETRRLEADDGLSRAEAERQGKALSGR